MIFKTLQFTFRCRVKFRLCCKSAATCTGQLWIAQCEKIHTSPLHFCSRFWFVWTSQTSFGKRVGQRKVRSIATENIIQTTRWKKIVGDFDTFLPWTWAILFWLNFAYNFLYTARSVSLSQNRLANKVENYFGNQHLGRRIKKSCGVEPFFGINKPKLILSNWCKSLKRRFGLKLFFDVIFWSHCHPSYNLCMWCDFVIV